MEQNIAEFIGKMQTPAKKMGIKELREREEIWRGLWSWIPENVKYLTYRIGSTIRLVKRDWKGSLGQLGEVHYEPTEYELVVYEKRYNETDGKFYYERKIVKISSSTVMMLEFILDSQLAEEAEKEEVMSLEGLEPVEEEV